MYQVHRSTRDIKSQKTLPCYRSISHQRTCRIHDSSINKEYTQKSEYTEICFAGFQNSFLIQDSCQKADHPKRKHLPRSPWSLSHKHIGQHHDQASYKETCLAAKRNTGQDHDRSNRLKARHHKECSSSGYTDGCQYRDHHDFSCLRLPSFKHHKERYHCRYDHDQAAYEILSSMKISH